MKVLFLLFVLILTLPHPMPKPRLTEADIHAVGREKEWKWLGLVEGEEMRANARTLWECLAGSNATRTMLFHNLKAKNKKHECAADASSLKSKSAAAVEVAVSDEAVKRGRGRPPSVNESTCLGVAQNHGLHWLGLVPGEEMGFLAMMRWSCIRCGEELPACRYDNVRDGKMGTHECNNSRSALSRAGARGGAIGGALASPAHKACAGAIGGVLASPVDKALSGAIGGALASSEDKARSGAIGGALASSQDKARAGSKGGRKSKGKVSYDLRASTTDAYSWPDEAPNLSVKQLLGLLPYLEDGVVHAHSPMIDKACYQCGSWLYGNESGGKASPVFDRAYAVRKCDKHQGPGACPARGCRQLMNPKTCVHAIPPYLETTLIGLTHVGMPWPRR